MRIEGRHTSGGLIISKDASEVDASRSFASLLGISVLGFARERLRSPRGGLRPDLSTPREAVRTSCIKKERLRGEDSSPAFIRHRASSPFDSIIIIDLAAKKKTRRNTNKPRDNASRESGTRIRFVLFASRTFTNGSRRVVVLGIPSDGEDTRTID